MENENKWWQLSYGKLALLSLLFIAIYYLSLYLKFFKSFSPLEPIGVVFVVSFLISGLIWLFKSIKQEKNEMEDSNLNSKWGPLNGWMTLLSSLIFILYSFIPYNYRSSLDNYPIMPVAFILALFFGIAWLNTGKGKKAIIKWSLIRIIIYTIILFLPNLGKTGSAEADMILYAVLFFADLLISIIVFIIKKMFNKH